MCPMWQRFWTKSENSQLQRWTLPSRMFCVSFQKTWIDPFQIIRKIRNKTWFLLTDVPNVSVHFLMVSFTSSKDANTANMTFMFCLPHAVENAVSVMTHIMSWCHFMTLMSYISSHLCHTLYFRWIHCGKSHQSHECFLASQVLYMWNVP